MKIDAKKIPNAVPFKEWNEDGTRNHRLDITDEVAYMLRHILKVTQVGTVFQAIMAYTANKELPDMDEAEFIVFCKMLMDNGLITDFSFKYFPNEER